MVGGMKEEGAGGGGAEGHRRVSDACRGRMRRKMKRRRKTDVEGEEEKEEEGEVGEKVKGEGRKKATKRLRTE